MGKSRKAYKKLMRSFEQLGFRQPYQLLLTSDIVLDTVKLDVMNLFQKTLNTKDIKPMITQCCIRALYAKNKPGPDRDPNVPAAIERAKTFERRRCGHMMDQDPLTERECMLSVVDPKGKGENKFRYVVASNDEWLRHRLRSVVPTPLMYCRRSVMILEPMSDASQQIRDREERQKFKDGIIRRPLKRKREDGEEEEASEGADSDSEGEDVAKKEKSTDAAPDAGSAEQKEKKKKKNYGPKQPNPLARKKAKKEGDGKKKISPSDQQQIPKKPSDVNAESTAEGKAKRKRRKKIAGGAAEGGDDAGEGQGQGEAAAAVAAKEE
ncbi:Fcf1-domain-containing protein [Pseudoneurospora amorphoporcata]|uniref:U three protein 23 n=1 Tax=Pseudoneurospora amorphoporcata TaxID=241081 RepID=A0AAN6P2K4_9PEZI|nr:Fcf1-domain-containing protein [Pseudoneurospora amorphoporcata]